MSNNTVNLEAPVVSVTSVTEGGFVLSFAAPVIARSALPGQFVYIKPVHLGEPILRRAFSVLSVNQKSGAVAVYFDVKGAGTRALSELTTGDKVSVLGPLGNGFPMDEIRPVNILVAGGCGIAPLLFLANTLKQKKRKVHFFYGVRTQAKAAFLKELRKVCTQFTLVSDDGSCGVKGLVTHHIHATKQEAVFSCGPKPMLRALALLVPESFVALETEMACGLGVCNGCAVKMTDGSYKRCCKEGPVFKAKEVEWI